MEEQMVENFRRALEEVGRDVVVYSQLGRRKQIKARIESKGSDEADCFVECGVDVAKGDTVVWDTENYEVVDVVPSSFRSRIIFKQCKLRKIHM